MLHAAWLLLRQLLLLRVPSPGRRVPVVVRHRSATRGRGLAAAFAPLALIGLVALVQACARAPDPVLPAALPQPAAASVTGALPVPAGIGLLRIAEGRITAIPADELGRWRGALGEVNRGMLYPIRAIPLAPAASVPEGGPGGFPGPLAPAIAAAVTAAAVAGLDAVLVYELSVAVSSNPGAAALSRLPLLGGIVPVTAMARAGGQGTALLIEARSGALIGQASARMADAAIAPLAMAGGSGRSLRPMADYAMLNLLAPRVEDMLTGAVANGR